MKMVVADDEILTLQLFERILDWSALGIEIVAFCKNGKDAFECIQKEKPDLLITDIKMPVMDGLELIQLLRNESNNIKIIVLSAHREFEYAQKALSHKVTGYILKPVDEIELEKIMIQAVQEIKKEHIQKQNDFERKRIIQERLLKQLIRFEKNISATDSIVKNAQINIPFTNYCLLNITIDNFTYEQHIRFDENSEDLFQKILNCLNNIHKFVNHSIMFENEPGEWLILLGTNDTCDAEKIAYTVLKRLKEKIYINCFISVSDVFHNINTLNSAYTQTKNLMKCRFYLPDINIISSSKFENSFQFEEIEFVNQRKMFIHYFKEGNISHAINLINNLFNDIQAHPVMDPERLYIFIYELLVSIKLEILKGEIHSNMPPQLNEIKPQDLKAYNTLDRLQNFFIKFIKEITQNIQNEKSENHYLISKAKEYIELHYNENISLDEICEYVCVSKNYFCYLFKRETNESIWNYLTRVRIEKSKDLLLHSNYKNYEVAYKVGYENPSYFTKTFKKLTGLTPQGYRSKHI